MHYCSIILLLLSCLISQPYKLMPDYRDDPSARCEYLDWRCFISPWERMTRCDDLDCRGRCFISPYYNTIVSQIEVKTNSNCERNCSNWHKFKSVSIWTTQVLLPLLLCAPHVTFHALSYYIFIHILKVVHSLISVL